MDAAERPTDCRSDVIIALDVSGGLPSSEFSLMKTFLSQYVAGLSVDSGDTRVGLVTYAEDVETVIYPNVYASSASLQAAVSALPYVQTGTQYSNTAAALTYVRTAMLTSAAGARLTVSNVVIVITAARSYHATNAQVRI